MSVFAVRLRPETTPAETLSVSPSGLPIATTDAPTSGSPPRVAGTTTLGSFTGPSSAMSVFLSDERTLAFATVPSAKVTVMLLPPATTWSAVRIVPSSATMTPVPRSWPVRTRTTDGASRW